MHQIGSPNTWPPCCHKWLAKRFIARLTAAMLTDLAAMSDTWLPSPEQAALILSPLLRKQVHHERRVQLRPDTPTDATFRSLDGLMLMASITHPSCKTLCQHWAICHEPGALPHRDARLWGSQPDHALVEHYNLHARQRCNPGNLSCFPRASSRRVFKGKVAACCMLSRSTLHGVSKVCHALLPLPLHGITSHPLVVPKPLKLRKRCARWTQ